jgi:hypothetical protein
MPGDWGSAIPTPRKRLPLSRRCRRIWLKSLKKYVRRVLGSEVQGFKNSAKLFVGLVLLVELVGPTEPIEQIEPIKPIKQKVDLSET